MVEVSLPSGYAREGAWRQTLWIRPWNGLDESLLEAMNEFPAARTTLLLSRCAYQDSGNESAPVEFVRSLTVGDREALLLNLRRITRGGKLKCVVRCSECKEAMDLTLAIDDLLLEPTEEAKPVYESELEYESVRYRVRFRLPNGDDQESAARLARRDPDLAARVVLERCIQDSAAAGIPDEIMSQISEEMSRKDPQAEMVFRGDCCHCGNAFNIPFDAAQFIFREIEMARGDLEREVHLLAYHYHWTEQEILAMSAGRRSRYTQRLQETLAERRRL